MVSSRPSRLQAELARRILTSLKERQVSAGHPLIELELCRQFDVSRTPVRGALKLLAAQGVVTRRGRGFALASLPALPEEEPADEDQEDGRLFQALGRARARGEIADQFTQQDLVRRFGARLGAVMRVLRHLQELGVLERKPGNGWAFIPDPARILSESYAFRRALEPQMLLQPGFKLDRAWAEKTRSQHQKLRKKTWQPGDGRAFHAVNADFHAQLARACGNRAMLKAVERHNQLRQFLIGQWDYPADQVRDAIDEHLEILAALEAGYTDKAAALMLHHLTQSASQSENAAA